MGLFSFFSKKEPPAVQLAPGRNTPFPFCALTDGYIPLRQELHLYETLREGIPIIDAAIGKLVRLVGTFQVKTNEPAAQNGWDAFFRCVPVNACEWGLPAFLTQYFDQLLTYGTGLGEMVLDRSGRLAALYNANLDDVEIVPGEHPLQLHILSRGASGQSAPVPYPALVLMTPLNPTAGRPGGNSLLRGLPFVSGILLKIYHAIGLNWERVGNVRFSVNYRPAADGGDRGYSKQRAAQIAEQWSKAMAGGQNGQVSDFVTVGDVSVKVIGADNQILDSNVPVRQLLEQIVAKLSIPPFLLGLSWSTTERMSAQQADILTSELDAYRSLLTPVISRICRLWLTLNGFSGDHEVVWDNINLQDEVELANARLLTAQAIALEQEQNGKGGQI